MTTTQETDIDKAANILRKAFGEYQDFPKKGIYFYDCLPLFEDPHTFNLLLDTFTAHLRPLNPTVIVGLDARGFIFAPPLALRLNCRFVPVRKKGKLPGETVQAAYKKEYGEDIFEMQSGRISNSDRVVVVDDLIATGGSAKAVGEIVRKFGAKLLEYAFIIELTFLSGAKNLDAPAWRLVTEAPLAKPGYIEKN